MGINIPSMKELIAAEKSIEEISEKLGADSVKYLTIDGLKAAVQNGLRSTKTSVGHCTACLTGSPPFQKTGLEFMLAKTCNFLFK